MSRKYLAAVGALVLLPVAVFYGALDNGLHLDDWYRVAGNPGVEDGLPWWQHFVDPRTSASLPRMVQYRPLLPLTLSWNYAARGHDLVGYHAVNLAVLVLTGLVVFALFRALLAQAAKRTGRADEARGVALPLAAALLFAVHPVSGVPVNYVCARDLALMQLFAMTALLLWVHLIRGPGGRNTPLRWTVVLLGMALSLASKTNAVALPLVALAYEFCLGGARLLSWRPWARVVPLVLVVVAFFLFTTLGLGFSDADQLGFWADPGRLWTYAATQLDLHVTHYLRNAVWPFLMRPLPSVTLVETAWHLPTLIGAAVVAITLVFAWRRRSRDPVLAFSIFAYWILFAPTSSLVPFRYLATDYRQYPSLPFLCLVGCLLVRRLLPARAAAAVALVAAAWFGGTSVWQNGIWQDEASLWGASVRHGGEPMAHVNYARAVQGSDPERAATHYRIAIERSPGNAVAHLNLGLLLIDKGEVDDGLARMWHGVRCALTWGDAWYWYAIGLSGADRVDEAASAALRATELDPRRFDYRRQAVQMLYAAALAARAQPPANHARCLWFLDLLHGLVEEHELSRFYEALSLQQLGAPEDAIPRYRRWLQRHTDHPERKQAWFNLAHAAMTAGRHAEAIIAFEWTLTLDPGFANAHYNLGTCWFALGEEALATRHRAEYERCRVAD